MPSNRSFPQRVKAAVLAAEPDAEVYLFGSRARGDAHAESDWDFLVLLDGAAKTAREDAVRRRVYRVELAAEEAASLFFYGREEWFGSGAPRTPFRAAIRREGQAL